jgi:stearoyl-CoA desaturase (delta-9 desaturase)
MLTEQCPVGDIASGESDVTRVTVLSKAERSPADRMLVTINIVAVVLPFVGLAAAMALTWGGAFDWLHLFIMLGMSAFTSVGITVGFHRLFTHKSFTAPAVVRWLLAVGGSMAVQGPVIRWCAEHRRHHQHSDTEEDPHSPHMSADGSWGEGVWAMLRGAYHAHVGWLFEGRSKGLGKYSQDLQADPVLAAVSRQFPFWVLAGLTLPAILGGLLTMSWMGALLGFLWGGLVRVLMVHHVTWSVNSICHIWGTRPFESHDLSRNNAIVGVLALGEGWHNNHHAFPTSARHGLRWWELDLSYIFIRGLEAVGLAKNVKTPDAHRVASKLRKPQ